jgi:hypothetical protein
MWGSIASVAAAQRRKCRPSSENLTFARNETRRSLIS